MAALQFSACTAAITLTGATAKTIVQILAPTNQRVKVLGWRVSFAGNSGTAVPVVVRVLYQTTAGTMSALTPKKTQRPVGSETIQTTALHTATVEPSAGDVVKTYHIHPQTGIDRPFTPGEGIVLAGGERLGIECTAPVGVDVIGGFDCEE